MEYQVNIGYWGNLFAVPTTVVDHFSRLASETQLKVLLYLLRNAGQSINAARIARDNANSPEDTGILRTNNPIVPNVIMDAINSVLHRTGVTDSNADVMSSGVGESLYRNIYTFFDDGNIIVLLVAILATGVVLFVNRKALHINNGVVVFCGLMIISPFVWLIVLSNHCSLHPHLEWRTLCIVVFALAVFVISMLPKTKQVEEK